jgi:hypothetical protein
MFLEKNYMDGLPYYSNESNTFINMLDFVEMTNQNIAPQKTYGQFGIDRFDFYAATANDATWKNLNTGDIRFVRGLLLDPM